MHFLGLFVLKFRKMGQLEFFKDKGCFEENLIDRLSRAVMPCLALVIPHGKASRDMFHVEVSLPL